jgi:hypothetical protein
MVFAEKIATGILAVIVVAASKALHAQIEVISTIKYNKNENLIYFIFKACFSGDMEVEVQGCGSKPISELVYGDMVKTLDTETMAPVYTKVLTYLHRDDNVEADFFLIKTKLNKALKLSAKHLIAKRNDNSQNLEYVYAKDLKVGDKLLSEDSESLLRIEEIEIVSGKGAYAPLTESGTLLVNGVLASCYAKVSSHRLAHLSMQPVFLLSRFTESVWTQDLKSSDEFSGSMFWYADLIYKAVTLAPEFISNSLFEHNI